MSTKGKINNRGFASIVVALILVLVFSLITLGFSQIARREQQNALNQQLGTKATYVAESGINQIIMKMKSGVTTGWSNTDCAVNITKAGITSNDSDSQVSCALVTMNTKDVITQNTPAQQSRISFVESTDGNNLDHIDFKWGSACPDTTDTACVRSNSIYLPNIPDNPNPTPSAPWSAPPVIQLSITSLSSYKRDDLINNTFNVFLYPGQSTAVGSVGAITASATNNANKYLVKCSASTSVPPTPCSVSINVSAYSSKKYMIRYMPIYRDASNTDSIYTTPGGSSVAIANSQAEIDITAKSQDIVKRLKVRVPIYNTSTTSTSPGSESPDFVLQAVNICKRIKTSPSGSDFITPTTLSSAATDNACNGLSDGPIVWN